jgi:RecJ-like exonuclease
MNEKSLLIISLIFSLLGVLIILFVSENIEIPTYKISEITKENLEDTVKVTGTLSLIKETKNVYLFNLKDETSEIMVIAFKKERIDFKDDQRVTIIGKVIEYQDQLEIQAEEIFIDNA